MTRRHWIMLGTVLAIALVLRMIQLGTRPIWYDEAFSILLAGQSPASIIAGTAADTMPPLYYFLLSGWMNLTQSIAGLRMLNVILGVALVGLVYVWGKSWVGSATGLLASGLAAISPFLIYHSQELRMYTLLGLACLSYVLLVERWLRSDGAHWALAVATALAAAAALYSHNLAGFTLIVPNLVLAIRRQWSKMRRLLLPQAMGLVMFLPWLVMVPGQIRKIQTAFWTPVPAAQELIQALLTAHTHLPLPESQLPLALFFTLLTLAFVVYGHLRALDVTGFDRRWMVAYVVIPPAILLLLSYVMRPVFVTRALILSVMAYLFLIAWLIARARAVALRWLLGMMFMAPLILALPAHYQFREFPRSPFDEAVQRIESIDPGALVLHDNKLSYFPMRVYAPEMNMAFLPDEPGSHNDTLAIETQRAINEFPVASLETAISTQERLWFVVFERAIEEYAALGEPDHPVLAQLDAEFGRARTEQVGDLLLIEFVRESVRRPGMRSKSGAGAMGQRHSPSAA